MIGVIVKNQDEANELIPRLLYPGCGDSFFIYVKDPDGPIDLTNDEVIGEDWNWLTGENYDWVSGTPAPMPPAPKPDIVIVSGANEEQLLSLSEQCAEAGVRLVNLDNIIQLSRCSDEQERT